MSSHATLKPKNGAESRKGNMRSKKDKRDDDVMNVRNLSTSTKNMNQQSDTNLAIDERLQHSLEKMCFKVILQQ